MAFNFKKNIVVGISVSPEIGLELAQIDFASKTILKYACKPLSYDNIRQEIADMDIFKETLQELLIESAIPKGSQIVLNIPPVAFKVADYPASLGEDEITNVIEEELAEHPIFQNTESCISAVALPNSTIQFNKIAYTAAQKVMLTEVAMQIKDLGYTLLGIDISVNSILNSLIYNDRVDTSPDASWVLLLVENNCCRVIPMQGRTYVDCFEEKISIGEVLGDAENYSTVINAISPILKNIPSQRLLILSKTNAISAKALAGKITYNGQIIHQEANFFATEQFLETDTSIDEDTSKKISLDVIGAAINRDFGEFSTAHFNLFNESLGDIYTLEQPPVIKLGSLTLVLSMENMIVASVALAVIILILTLAVILPLQNVISQKEAQRARLEQEIAVIEKFLKDNKDISSKEFDEGDEIRMGLIHNKAIYTYYTIVGTEIPKKLWLTSLELGNNTTIEGQADNLESIYSFYRNIKDYNPESNIKLQKLGLATSSHLTALAEDENFDTDSIITSMNADFYEFRISDAPEVALTKDKKSKDKDNNESKTGSSSKTALPDLEPLE